jgi:hypothetical protein
VYASSPRGKSWRWSTSLRIRVLITKKLDHMKKLLLLTRKSRLRRSKEVQE